MGTRKLNILVAGGYDPKDPATLARPVEEIRDFVKELGRELIEQGHTLLTGCRTELDSLIAASAEMALKQTGRQNESSERIISYVNQGRDACHDIGSIRQSELVDWELGGKDLNPLEIIRDADAVILIGGFRGTYRAANWARIERTPLLRSRSSEEHRGIFACRKRGVSIRSMRATSVRASTRPCSSRCQRTGDSGLPTPLC